MKRGCGGIAQVVDRGHPVGAPAARRAVGDEVGDAGVALPPVLVRALEPVEHRGDERGLRRIGHVPDLVGQVAERAEEVGLLARPARQRLAVADARHRRAARLRLARRAGDVVQVPRLRRIGHVHDGGAVLLHLAGERVHPQAAVVADVGDEAAALLVDHGLIGGAGLQIVGADEPHVVLLGGPRRRRDERQQAHQEGDSPRAHGPVSVGIDAPSAGGPPAYPGPRGAVNSNPPPEATPPTGRRVQSRHGRAPFSRVHAAVDHHHRQPPGGDRRLRLLPRGGPGRRRSCRRSAGRTSSSRSSSSP